MTTPERQTTDRDAEEIIARATEDQLRRLLQDLYRSPAWHAREPMGRA